MIMLLLTYENHPLFVTRRIKVMHKKNYFIEK